MPVHIYYHWKKFLVQSVYVKRRTLISLYIAHTLVMPKQSVNKLKQWIFLAWCKIRSQPNCHSFRLPFQGKDFLVITGSHGLCQLDDVNANKREIHLNLERPDLARLPVPRYVGIYVIWVMDFKTLDVNIWIWQKIYFW